MNCTPAVNGCHANTPSDQGQRPNSGVNLNPVIRSTLGYYLI